MIECYYCGKEVYKVKAVVKGIRKWQDLMYVYCPDCDVFIPHTYIEVETEK